ncbi:5-formyltetrahydrofolate cyclo-ligase [Paenibacillus larvae subsp. pulvifaciens]|uniref:5-formyltetrahydrofolate cyclo-ligase n=2 Tax=Paenibacillus larvae TaxID=1464 RepID=A0A1V0UTV3_9BACL|nr:5-formyltetrahydrofolate cyclo-ligase [Paenibacillus larvae subsp. pulvifaciens]
MNMYIKVDKARLRKQVEEKRALLTGETRRQKEESIGTGLISFLRRYLTGRQDESPPTVLTYMPFRTEADVTPVLEYGWTEGIRMVVPRVEKEQKQMAFYVINSYDDLETGIWGIREPRTSLPRFENMQELTLILVPGLVFDRQGGRLGYGGGYYDRLIHKMKRDKFRIPYLLAGAFDCQIIPHVPGAWHDFRVDTIITESRCLHPVGKRKE